MDFGGSWWLLMIHGSSLWSLAVLSYSWLFFVVLGYFGTFWWFLLVLGDYLWLFVVFCGSL